MAIMAADTGGGGDFKPVPQGTHIAICNQVVDLGKQRTDYNGETKVQHKVWIRWELPNERLEWEDKDGNGREGPMVIGKSYTLSLHEKAALRGDLEAWRGQAFTKEELAGFDVSKLLGKACQITITHAEKNGRIYANVSSVAGFPKGMERPTATELVTILYDEDHPGAYDDLPDWLKKKLDEQVRDTPQPSTAFDTDLDDDIPF